ncbi:alpha-tectorin-like [Exaiptasia diaphana]|uniref:NIDO domain-containing protein n=1 Tax=Exaiptasia diaphana TaxID=2652724 RepID=A0A913X0D7_EXADI|nr:alpha-tectorin-like [Exaiptasia diaphana]
MIAPFWADVVTTKGGAIWYRQTTSKNVLREASLDVRNAFPEFPNFSARWMFVATWEKVPFYGTKNKNITNTFQSVLLSDGRHSFVRFNYYNITWTSATTSGGKSSNGLGGTEASCGFNSGFGNYHYNVTNNGYRNISVLDLPHKTNVKQPGVLMFRTDGITIQEPTGRTTKGGESEWVKMNFDEVCFGARNDAYGSFVNHVKGGRVAAIKLVYLRGFVRCANSAVHNSRWGCSGIKKLSHFPFNVIGTNQNNRVLFPKEEILVYSTMWYNLPFADNQHSNELVFTGDYFNSFHFPLNDQMKIWYGEDLANHSERDNHGRVCVDVYVKFI